MTAELGHAGIPGMPLHLVMMTEAAGLVWGRAVLLTISHYSLNLFLLHWD